MFHPSWSTFLKSEFNKPYFQTLSNFLKHQYQTYQIFPPKSQVFSAFTTDLDQIKVVILDQDPYHTPGMAHGLAFSVPPNAKIPPSLVNIYKEITADLQINTKNRTGNLENWQNQGILLLNNVLTVQAHQAGSHRNQGWEIFTKAVITHLSNNRENLVFLLWGNDAKTKANLINSQKHLILTAAHPSPLSAHHGFFGCRHFSKTNEYLKNHQKPPINW